MSKHVQAKLSDKEFKMVKLKATELDKEMREFAREALLEKVEREDQKKGGASQD